MDDDSIIAVTKNKGESNNKIKDGYAQLAEKMEQVRKQVAIMERKYDELYQTVKENTKNLSLSSSSDPIKAEETKSKKGSVTNITASALAQEALLIPETPTTAIPVLIEKKPEEKPKSPDLDIEKMEDNPFF